MPASAQLTLCAVVTRGAGEDAASLKDPATREAEDALAHARIEISGLHDADVHLRNGPPIPLLLDELTAQRATLVAVGSHGQTRAAGIRHGSVATAMLHEAPRSVLIAHGGAPAETGGGQEIVVIAFDGSPAARGALAAARELSGRLSLKPRVVVATGGPMIAPELPWLAEDLGPEVPVVEDPRGVTEALVDASASARLLIIGSRHLRGLPALWSASERTGHAARCPVLIVR